MGKICLLLRIGNGKDLIINKSFIDLFSFWKLNLIFFKGFFIVSFIIFIVFLIFEINDIILTRFSSSFSSLFVILLILSFNLISSFISDKVFSIFSFTLVTSFCNFSISSFSSFNNSSCFSMKYCFISFNVLSNKVFIFTISLSILFFKFNIFSNRALNSSVVFPIVKSCLLRVSLSFNCTNLWSLWSCSKAH